MFLDNYKQSWNPNNAAPPILISSCCCYYYSGFGLCMLKMEQKSLDGIWQATKLNQPKDTFKLKHEISQLSSCGYVSFFKKLKYHSIFFLILLIKHY